MNIQKNNDFYDKEFTNEIEEYQFNSTILENESILINDLKSQIELDISLSVDSLGKSRIELKIPFY